MRRLVHIQALSLLCSLALIFLDAIPGGLGAEEWADCSKGINRASIEGCSRAIDTWQYAGKQAGNKRLAPAYLFRAKAATTNVRKALRLDLSNDEWKEPRRLLLAADEARASPEPWEECISADPDQAIPACKVLLEGSQLKGKLRGLAQFGIGKAYLEKEDYDRAITGFTMALFHRHKTPEVYFLRGKAFALKGKRKAAIDDYSAAIKLDRNYEPAYANRGLLYSEQGSYEQAIKDFEQSLRLNPGQAETHFNRADAFRQWGYYGKAIDGYTEALHYDADYADAYNNRGIVLHIKGQYDEAIEDYSRVISLQPDYANAYFNRGLAYLQLGQRDKADADWDRYVGITRTNLDSSQAADFNLQCWDLALTGKAEQALPLCRTALKINPRYAAAWDSLAFVQWQLGQPEEARASLQKARELDPELVDYQQRMNEYLTLLVHQALLHLGFEPGVVDENSDDQDGRLSAAIEFFQGDAGLKVTGKASPETYQALKQRIRNRGRSTELFGNKRIEPTQDLQNCEAQDTGFIMRKHEQYTIAADSTGMIIDGKLGTKLAKEVREILEASPGIHTVHLDSTGGTLSAGLELFDLFAERGIHTYSFNRCIGACTLAFVGGETRTIHPSAQFKFTPIRFTEKTQRQQQSILRTYMRRESQRLSKRGISPEFVRKIQSVHVDSKAWKVSREELHSSGFITDVEPAYPPDLHRLVVNLPIDGESEEMLYEVRVDGSTLKIEGRFGWGLDKRIKEVFCQNGDIQTVELDSLGGRTPVGLRLFDLFSQQGVDTYVPRECGSACTMAFLAGEQRIISPGAKLGFHRTGVKAETEDKLLRIFFDINRQRYSVRGIEPWFFDKVAETPNSEVWIPSQEELLSSGFVTEIAD